MKSIWIEKKTHSLEQLFKRTNHYLSFEHHYRKQLWHVVHDQQFQSAKWNGWNGLVSWWWIIVSTSASFSVRSLRLWAMLTGKRSANALALIMRSPCTLLTSLLWLRPLTVLCLSPKKEGLACRLHIPKLIEIFTIDKTHSGITL